MTDQSPTQDQISKTGFRLGEHRLFGPLLALGMKLNEMGIDEKPVLVFEQPLAYLDASAGLMRDEHTHEAMLLGFRLRYSPNGKTPLDIAHFVDQEIGG